MMKENKDKSGTSPGKEKNNEKQAILFVKEPIRTDSSYNAQGSIAKTLTTMSENASARLSTHSIKQHQQNIERITELTQEMNFNKIDETTDNFIKKIEENAKKREKKNE